MIFIDENEKFAPITLGPNTFEFPSPVSIKKWGVTLNAYEWGYLSNVFISADFIKEAAKGADNNREFLEKIINDDKDIIAIPCPIKAPIGKNGMVQAVGEVINEEKEMLYKVKHAGSGAILIKTEVIDKIIIFFSV